MYIETNFQTKGDVKLMKNIFLESLKNDFHFIYKLNRSGKFVILLIFLLIYQDSVMKITGLDFLKYIDELIVLFIFLYSLKDFFSLVKERYIIILIGLAFCFTLTGYVSYFLNSSSSGGITNAVLSSFLSLKFFIVVISLLHCRVTLNHRDLLIRILKIAAKFTALFAIFNFLFPNIFSLIFPFTTVNYRFGIVSVGSLFVHQAKYGWFMYFVALLYLSEFLVSKDKKYFQFYFVYCVFALISLKVKVIVSVLLISVITCCFYHKLIFKSINKYFVIFITFCGGLIVSFTGPYIYEMIIYYLVPSTSTSARSALLSNSINIMLDYFPFGVGFGKYGSYYSMLNYSEYYTLYGMSNIYGLSQSYSKYITDTFWPMILGETGFFGFVCYAAFIAVVLVKILKKAVYSIHRGIDIFPVWAFLIIGQALIESLAEPIFNTAPQYLLIGVVIALGCHSYKSDG